MTNNEKDALVRAIALLAAKGNTTLAESYLPWIYSNKQPKADAVKRFTPPTVEEVAEYCRQRRNGIDAETFCAHYASKGWKVGNVKMTDWKAAVRTWEKRRNEPTGASVFSDPEQYWK